MQAARNGTKHGQSCLNSALRRPARLTFCNMWNPWKKKKGVTQYDIPDKSESRRLDVTKAFEFGVKVTAMVPILPLETFSERLIAEYENSDAEIRETLRCSLFHPQPDGTLRIYVAPKGEKGKSN